MTTLTLPTPPEFRFWPTVVSHGWCDLPPYQCDESTYTFTRIHQLSDGRVIRLVLRDAECQMGSLTVHVEGVRGKLSARLTAEIQQVVRRALEMDRDLTPFYALLRPHPRYSWVEVIGAGRMLSAPTVWEDLAKTLLTTNTTWRMTVQMVTRLNSLGDSDAHGGQAFPTPERIAALTPESLDQHIRAGYRSPYLHQLATRIATGDLEVESWRDAALPTAEVHARITALKGFGDYAAGNMLRLLGHFDRLATDSVCRAVYRDQINDGVEAAHDKEIAAYYERFGGWRGLVQWMDVMEHYLRGTS
jgi:3-methyladenine DNA glycosylase/8-oxoguanine DNA glycosylase